MPIYEYKCTKCEEISTDMCSYTERETPIDCDECGSKAEIIFSAVAFKPSVGGAHAGRLIAPDVGPNSTKSRAYQKKMDDSVSTYAGPGQHGSMTAKGRKEFALKQIGMDAGQTKFTK
tara:strand:+ start:64 stop:417 length:354 start_codon:yes stop_codon:yes gene_type:complete